jgi:hypothetical protein
MMMIIITMMIIMFMINKNNGDIGFETWSIAEKTYGLNLRTRCP